MPTPREYRHLTAPTMGRRDRRGYPSATPSAQTPTLRGFSWKRGFRAGLRVALLAVFLLAVWWAHRTLAAS